MCYKVHKKPTINNVSDRRASTRSKASEECWLQVLLPRKIVFVTVINSAIATLKLGREYRGEQALQNMQLYLRFSSIAAVTASIA